MNTETYRSGADIPRDEVLRTLAARHRRLVLDILADSDQDEVCLQRLVKDVVARCPSDGRPVIKRREQGHIDLVHTHLPDLEDNDIIDWNTTNSVVTVGPEFERVVTVLQKIQTDDSTDDEC
jgi:hypothetical protein